jgi:uncharacterized protein (DUF1684 family)
MTTHPYHVKLIMWLMLLSSGLSESYLMAQSTSDQSYVQSISDWHQERIAALTGPRGWLALKGLYWLKEGINVIGNSAGCQVRLPIDAPNYSGTVLLINGQAKLVRHQSKGSESTKGEKGDTIDLQYLDWPPTFVTWESWQWYLLKRSNQIGLRLMDTLATERFTFDSVAYYPVSKKWLVPATFAAAKENDTIKIENVVGMTFRQPPAGWVTFTHNGSEYQLSVLPGSDNSYFLIFSDETTGVSTYGGGRYLYIDAVEGTDQVVIDFNKAYNPPCAFTDFATCLLPTPGNHLPFEITAGEFNFGDH